MANGNVVQNGVAGKDGPWDAAVICRPIVEQVADKLGLDLSNQVVSDTLSDGIEGGFFMAVYEFEYLIAALYNKPWADGYPDKFRRGCDCDNS